MDAGQEVKVSPEEMERLRLEREARQAAYESKEAKRERAEIALRFAVALLSNSSIHIHDDGGHPKSVASDSFIFADAFLAARDGAK